MVRDEIGHYNTHEVMRLSIADFVVIGVFIECFLYGLYSGIFAIYLQGTLKRSTDKRNNIIFYALCALYVLSVVTVVVDIARFTYNHIIGDLTTTFQLGFLQTMVVGFCDFIAQSILIYRCWIVWGCNIRVVILPSILAVAYLVIWIVSSSFRSILSGQVVVPDWTHGLTLAALAVSMTVNALVTFLIVFKIFRVYCEIGSTSDDQSLGATAGSKFRAVIFIIIESGMILFSIQLARVLGTIFVVTDAGDRILKIIIFIHQMLNGITPTIILVRVYMGLSFHDKESMRESTIESLRFAADNPNSISETEDHDAGIVRNDAGIVNGDDNIGVRQGDDIEMVDR
ncbi:hypothetical protein BYT27DRAFT_7334049 [Phlegmacium glaucopus]|nr:hypothetical protein BYT27DRAFT_7334049 [Phlegmacium glaucopus]